MSSKNSSSLTEKVRVYTGKHSLDKWVLHYNKANNLNAAIVIPALAEYNNIKKLLASLLKNNADVFKSILIIFIVNNLEDSSEEIKADNKLTLEFIRNVNSAEPSDDSLVNEIRSSGLRIGYIDASSNGLELPAKDGGVGLARKIGMDLSLSVFDYETEPNKIIVCLDSDCTVAANYLQEINKLTGRADFYAGAVNFAHPVNEAETMKAIICYEIFLRYYVAGLQLAGSPYAFHTIGSTMICNVEAYIKTGGMNKRKAAEDFYFLEKLSKNYKIEKINSTTIFPSPRVSFRVPFGTGQRVRRFLEELQNEYLLYSPDSFLVLKKWLAVFNDNSTFTSEVYLSEAKKINERLYDFLAMNNFKIEWQRILENSKTPEQISHQKNVWFDGFRTLKLIHYLRDSQFPPAPMFDALDRLFGLLNISSDITRAETIPELNVQEEYLKILRRYF